MRIILFLPGDSSEGRDLLIGELEKLGIRSIVTFDSGETVSDFLGRLNDSLSGENKCLCIVSGYRFDEASVAAVFARAVDSGMRLLVFSSDIDNKQLAELLKISNIKHKVRIEKIDLADRDDPARGLVAGILDDEIRRLA